jgi:hypothetical protein
MVDDFKNGKYTVNGRVFISKTQALIEASKSGHNVEWDFSNSAYSLIDWTTGGVNDVSELYRRRARQLREKYDYLILSYSGGSDSWTALHSFLSIGVTVDEIFVKWPFKATNDLFTVSRSLDPSNILSEWELNIKPDLDYIANNYPSIKITVYDWSDDIANELTEDDWYNVNDHLNPGVFRKFTILADKEQQMLAAGKKTAIIWGVDKPQIGIRDGHVYTYFLDKIANTRSLPGMSNRNTELFYWTPDMPNIAHAQTRLFYEFLVNNPTLMPTVVAKNTNANTKKTFDAMLRGIIYPNWNPQKFQADKPFSQLWNGGDQWMFTHLANHRYFQSWKHGLANIKAAVSPKFYQLSSSGEFDGWVGFTSPWYDLGPAPTIT